MLIAGVRGPVARYALIAEFRGSVRSQRRDRSAAPHHRTPTRRNAEDAEDAEAAENCNPPLGSSPTRVLGTLISRPCEMASFDRSNRSVQRFQRFQRFQRSVVLRHHHASGCDSGAPDSKRSPKLSEEPKFGHEAHERLLSTALPQSTRVARHCYVLPISLISGGCGETSVANGT